MKTKLTLSIDENKIKKIKKYAKQNDTSVSSLVEEHFDKLVSNKANPYLDARELVGIFGKVTKGFDAGKIHWEHLKKKHGL